MNTFDLTLRLLVGLVLLFIITKVLGKTQISQITPFDFIFSIVLGELFVHAVFAQHNGLFQLFYTLTLWGALIYLFELLAEKFLKLRGFLEGKPAIIVREGRIDRKQLQRNRLNLDQLLNLLRQNQVFALAEVKYAILEMNGSLSVLKYSGADTPSRKDLQLPETPVFLPVTLISDGKILSDDLKGMRF